MSTRENIRLIARTPLRSFQQSEFCVVNRLFVCLSETQYLNAEIE